MNMNQLILGDCLEVMRKMDSESVDLIYLDPPFFSNRNYEVIWGDKGEVRSFEDRWSGGIDHYIAWLKERVAEMHRLLKPTGSIYLHCDWHANSYIRVYILDKLFGQNNFRNEIIWCYNGPSNLKTSFPNKHDTIFRYVKSNDNILFNKDEILIPYSEETLKRRTYAETKKKGIKFKGKDIEEYQKGMVPFDWWNDIPSGGQMSRNERIGYPTQKPEKLLDRIIKASSNEGDTILDPFVGGGTTVVVADKLNRNWIGIDQSVQAIKVSEMRIDKQQGLYSKPFYLQLHKYDYDTLRNKEAFEFESWIITQFGGIPNNRRGGDRGFDGKMKDGTPIQVKRSENIGINVIKNFLSSCQINEPQLFENKKNTGESIGYIIAFSYGRGAVQEVAKIKNEMGVSIELITVDKIVPIAKKPQIIISLNDKGYDNKGLHEIDFTAVAESEAGIEMFAWDWDYEEEKPFKAEVLLDKSGNQTMKFKPGNHTIAVKVVDNDGLEAIEIIKLKVNGVVEREEN